MNHGDHDGSMPMGPQCSMNMLWNTQIADTCIVFRQWHISSTTSLIISCLVIAAFGVFYEYLRLQSKVLDIRIATAIVASSKGKGRASNGRNSPDFDRNEEVSGLLSGKMALRAVGAPVPMVSRLLRAVLYGATVFLSFFLMLVFMTYNAYLIFATVLGAAIGHYVFGSHMDAEAILAGTDGKKGMACH